jgi:hypothetical protein
MPASMMPSALCAAPPVAQPIREQLRRGAHDILSDPYLIVLDVQATGLDTAWVIQIGLTDRYGNVPFNELVNPLADITPQAEALHGLAPNQLSTAPAFPMPTRSLRPPADPALPDPQRGFRPSGPGTRKPSPAPPRPLGLGLRMVRGTLHANQPLPPRPRELTREPVGLISAAGRTEAGFCSVCGQ